MNLDKMLSDDGTISMSLIVPDENQPRKSFDLESLRSLADSINEVGLKSPISVRYDSELEKYVINHGERRFRACAMLGLNSIPAIIDNNYDDYAQVIENIQREDLSARDISAFIIAKIKQGHKKGDIAKRLGKSGAYVSQYSSFGNMDENLKLLYENNVCNDITTLIELKKIYEKYDIYRDQIDEWVSKQDIISRSDIKKLIKTIELLETGFLDSDSENVDLDGFEQADLDTALDNIEQTDLDVDNANSDFDHVDSQENGLNLDFDRNQHSDSMKYKEKIEKKISKSLREVMTDIFISDRENAYEVIKTLKDDLNSIINEYLESLANKE